MKSEKLVSSLQFRVSSVEFREGRWMEFLVLSVVEVSPPADEFISFAPNSIEDTLEQENLCGHWSQSGHRT